MIKLVDNGLEGMYAISLTHPVTVANPAPWQITEMRLSLEGGEVIVWIRGYNSIWFQATSCEIASKQDIEEYQRSMEREKQRWKQQQQALRQDLRKTFNLEE